MRHVPRAVVIGILVLANGAGCGQKAAERVTAGVQQIQTALAMDGPITIAVDPIGSVRIDDGRPRQLASLTTVMRSRAARLEQADIAPAQIPIRISVDDDARYANFAQVVDACRNSGFYKFEVVVAKDVLSFNLAPADRADRIRELLPLTIRLKAGNDGVLAAVRLHDKHLEDVHELPAEVADLIGLDRGPGSFYELARIDFYCDDNLRFQHLAAAYLSVSRCRTKDGSHIALVRTIWPGVGWSTPDLIEDEFLEEMPIEPIEVQTTETGFDLELTTEVFVEPPEAAILPTFSFDDLPPDAPINISAAPIDVSAAPIDISAAPIDISAAPIDVEDAVPDDAPAKAKCGEAPTDESVDESAEDKQNVAAVIEPEPPVAAALRWLVDHQLPNGSWSFEHRDACRGRCDGFGTASGATNAATAMALLPFLAVGQTHQRGEHQQAVGRGVAYLIRQGKRHEHGVSFLESQGNMYSHGLATMALCETYRQTKDDKLKIVCQPALDFIDYAQDPVGGGWRYRPRQPGDTSVGGWQVAALRGGQLAGLIVPAKTLQGATRFLDTVQSDEGLTYGYTTPGAGRATTASGLLSRIHLGGKRDDKVWRRGVARLNEVGPSRTDMYFNYHATQAVSQHGGELWAAWQTSIRGLLLDRQAMDGHATGSWHVSRGHSAARGGRLFDTSLATLILTVQHRQLGIFQVAVGDE